MWNVGQDESLFRNINKTKNFLLTSANRDFLWMKITIMFMRGRKRVDAQVLQISFNSFPVCAVRSCFVMPIMCSHPHCSLSSAPSLCWTLKTFTYRFTFHAWHCEAFVSLANASEIHLSRIFIRRVVSNVKSRNNLKIAANFIASSAANAKLRVRW